MQKLYKYENVIPVLSSTGGFYNPDSLENNVGEFYLQINGHPKEIEILHEGNVDVYRTPIFPKNILLSNNQRGKITLSSLVPCEYPSEKLFTFRGDITKIINVKISNWGAKHIYSNVVNYDQTNTPLNSSKTNFEDDSIVIKDVNIKRPTNRIIRKATKRKPSAYNIMVQREQLKLPDSYVNISEMKNQYCHNCYFFIETNYCEKWDAKVSHSGWCASWQKKGDR